MNLIEPPAAIDSWQMSRRASVDPGDSTAWEMTRRRVPVPELADDEVLVAIAACGVCGTDLGFFYHGIPTLSKPPLILGHEISGTVVAGPRSWLGKEVIVPTIIPCRRCDLCRDGRSNRCLHQHMPGNSYGVFGGFASHIPVPARELCVVPHRNGLSLEALAVVADAVATPYQAARRAGIAPGDRVIIVGATGALGLFQAQWAKRLGAQTVVGLGRNADKLEDALLCGADFTINIADKSPMEVKKEFFVECRRRDLDAKSRWKIFEMTGHTTGKAIALELLCYAGLLMLVGYGPEATSWQLSKLTALDAEVRGTWGCPPEQYPWILDQVLTSTIQVAPLVELRPMSRIRETFSDIRARGHPGKRVVLVPDF